MARPTTSATASRFVVSAVMCTALIGSALAAQAQKKVQHPLFINDSLMGRLAHGLEARDEQPLVEYRQGEKKDGGPRLFAVKTLATWASVLPNDSLRLWSQDDDFRTGQLVAAVSLEDGDVPNLYLYKNKPNAIYLYFDGAEWYALVNNDATKRLKVTRYTYLGLFDKDFPVTARWDWEGATPTYPVLGIRCARGWCLIGTAGSQSYGKDPDDPGRDGTPPQIPAYRRVRGWYDRKVNTVGPGNLWIFPGPETEAVDDDSQFLERWHHQMNVRIDGVPDELELEVTKKRVGGWKWRRKNAGNSKNVIHKAFNGRMPAAARWSADHIDLPIPKPLAGTAATSLAQLTSVNLGDAWVRCASGCCSASILY